MSKTLAELRSRRWFADAGMRGFAHRQRLQQMGMRRQDVMDRPIIGIYTKALMPLTLFI